jgi:NADPH-dependent 7-cyano-7-deazaguanine reductase QueF
LKIYFKNGWAKVEIVMKPRGGIETVVSAEYPQNEK